MSTKAFLFIASILFISLSCKANTADLFAYNETSIEQQLIVVSNAEAEFFACEQSTFEVKEKNHLVNMVASSGVDVSNNPDVGFLSFAAGCCLGLPGVAVVSLHYYYQNGSAAADKSLNVAMIGFSIRIVAVVAFYAYAIANSIALGI